MQILRYSFVILTYVGGWRPVLWSSSWTPRLYDLLTCLMIFTIYTFVLTEFIDLLKPIDDVSEFTNNCFIFLSNIGACSKVTNILRRRENIIEVIDILEEDLCKPKNSEETEIQYKFDREIRINTYLYTGLVEVAYIAVTTSSLLNDYPKRILPFKAWLPYSLETSPAFHLAYFHQIIATAICAFICAGSETLITGLMLQTCAQLEILRHRLINLPKLIEESRALKKSDARVAEYKAMESKLFSECIKHHQRILEFSKSLNEIFTLVIFIQFAISSIVVCTSLFKLSKMSVTSVEFLSMMLYLLTVLVQLFIYCWYGNEVILQSIEVGNAAYNMDWTFLEVITQKNLLILIIRTLRPIKFTSGNIITLSIGSYNSLIKLSYSAYNGLQQSTNR